MTLKIEVFVPENDVRTGEAGKYIDTAFSAIGFYRREAVIGDVKEKMRALGDAEKALRSGSILGAGSIVQHSRTDTAATVEQAIAREVAEGDADPEGSARLNNPQVFDKPARERGKPSPGRQRRTREEIAEDEAAEKAGAVGEAQEPAPEQPSGLLDDAATAAQDAADEAAESAERTELTLDDLRQAVGRYQRTYGMAATTADVQTLLGKKMIDVTDDELASAIETMKIAVDDNPFGRAVVGKAAAPTEGPKEPAVEPEPVYTKADVIAALMDYALRYDGQNIDQTKMPITMEDGPKVLKMIFGDGVGSAGKIPPSPENYAKAVAGVREMIAKDPFKRGGKAGV